MIVVNAAELPQPQPQPGPNANGGEPTQPEPGKWNQPATTVKILRLGVGAIGFLLPLALVVGNWIIDGKVSHPPSSMSSSYYTHTRNVFVGLLCALGVFLIFYWPTLRQALCTCFAGVCALLVAFDPTAPPPGQGTEPAWINYLHHSAAGGLIFTLGLFCLVIFFAGYPHIVQPDKGVLARFRAWVASFRLWWRYAWASLRGRSWNSFYIICGLLILVAGGLALYTGIWPAAARWSAGWWLPSLYTFEIAAVWAFGAAWIVASLEDPRAIQNQVAAAMELRAMRVERSVSPDPLPEPPPPGDAAIGGAVT